MSASTYDGPVGFGSDGVHYPIDGDGHLDITRPLRWVEGAVYRDAEDAEALHNDVHHQRLADVDPGTIILHEAGRRIYPAGAHVVSDDAVTYFLADEYGNHVDGQPLAWDGQTNTFYAVAG